MGVYLHKEHGLNPTVTVCYLCGQEKNELILLGASYKEKAPMHMCVDREPCDKCKKLMAIGIIVIEVKDTARSANEAGSRTGRLFVVSDNFIRKVLTKPEPVISMRVCFMPKEVVDRFGLGDARPTHSLNKEGEVVANGENIEGD